MRTETLKSARALIRYRTIADTNMPQSLDLGIVTARYSLS